MAEPAVLRVLSGRLAGTSHPLPPAGTLSVGHEYWQNVVIREPATKGIAVDLTTSDDTAQAQIAVLSGEAVLLGQTIGAGGTAILPAYVPFSIGGVSLAWGDPDSDRWGDAGSLVVAPAAGEPAVPDARDEMLAAFERAREGASGLATRRNGLILFGAAMLLLAMFAALPIVDALGLRPDPATRVQRAIDAAGLTGLKASNRPGEASVTINGVVAGERERNRAATALRDSGVAGTVDVQTSVELAQAVADVARGRGLQARARPIGRTGVELHTSALTNETRAQLLQTIKTDVRSAGQITLIDDLLAANEIPIKALSDLTRKVSNIVTGDPSFIQTVDGARYFSGALMPSGHRLLGIEGHTVYLEKSGRRIKVEF